MSHTNSTTNYNLPQFITTDKPAWLTDVNNAYSAIDLGMHAAKTAADNAQGDATQAITNAGNAQTTANGADGKASGAISSISEAFLDSSTYDVGDMVMYNNLLYICHTAVIVPGAWTGSTNWSRTDIDSQLIRKLEDLNGVTITSPTEGETLLFNNNGDLVNGKQSYNDLSNTPTSYTTSGLTPGYGITIEAGGYAKLGKIVIVDIRMSISDNATGNIIAGFPLPNVSNNAVSLTNNKLQDIVLGTNGIVSTTATLTGTLILSGVYISQ